MLRSHEGGQPRGPGRGAPAGTEAGKVSAVGAGRGAAGRCGAARAGPGRGPLAASRAEGEDFASRRFLGRFALGGGRGGRISIFNYYH